MTTNVSLDLETLGTVPGSTILSIGAVEFGPNGVGPAEFYTVISRRSCANAGLTEDADTLAWWQKQSYEARTALIDATNGASGKTQSVAMALSSFDMWLNQNLGGDVCVWGNGSDFDNALMMEAYRRTGHEPGWPYKRNRCYRTLAALAALRPDMAVIRKGVAHNALDDARTQAEHAVRILNALPVVW